MTQFDSKVVSFDRNASYLHERAMKNKKSGRETDALELMRQAVEKEPDNSRYQMDLAALMSEMGLYEQAYMIFESLLMLDPPPVDALYAMGVMQFHTGNIPKAERILRTYVEITNGSRIAEAKRLIDEIMIAREVNRPDRKTMRAMRCVDRACRMMSAGDHSGSEKMFRLAIRMNDSAPEVHALRGMNMHLWGKDDAALQEIETAYESARKYGSGMLRSLCISAQILMSMGKREEAVAKIREAFSEEADGNDLRLLLNAMFECAMHEEIHEKVKKAIAQTPYDKTLLHALSVSAYHMGLDEEEVLAGWRRIERMDPRDPACRYFMKAAEAQGNSDITYVYRMPSEEMTRRAKVVMNAMLQGDDQIRNVWFENEEFRRILKWEIYQPDSRFTRLALSALMGVDIPETRKILSVYAERPDTPVALRTYVMQIAQLTGKGLEKTLPDAFLSAGLPTEEEAMETLSVGEKQMIRYAAEYVEDKYRDYPVADVALIWRAFVEKRGALGVSMVATEAGSAALAMCYLNMRGLNDDIYTVSRWYGCSARQAAYVAKLIRNTMNSVEEV